MRVGCASAVRCRAWSESTQRPGAQRQMRAAFGRAASEHATAASARLLELTLHVLLHGLCLRLVLALVKRLNRLEDHARKSLCDRLFARRRHRRHRQRRAAVGAAARAGGGTARLLCDTHREAAECLQHRVREFAVLRAASEARLERSGGGAVPLPGGAVPICAEAPCGVRRAACGMWRAAVRCGAGAARRGAVRYVAVRCGRDAGAVRLTAA
eukprot:742944-Prymnesium_polylepis.1